VTARPQEPYDVGYSALLSALKPIPIVQYEDAHGRGYALVTGHPSMKRSRWLDVFTLVLATAISPSPTGP
jgi:hypothetical protein